jgi:predicted DsbA family dithiol-disulfide isomerase
LEKLQREKRVQIRWRAFELRPSGAPPISPEYRARIEAARPAMEKMAREQYGLEMNPGPFGINSRPALVGSKFAEEMGVSAAYHDALFKAYWRDSRDIGDMDLLTDCAAQIGLDPTQFRAALTTPRFEEAVDADIAQARQYGLSGVPASVFAGKYLISGAQPYALFAEVADKAAADQNTG